MLSELQRSKILVVIKVPPPLTGATLMNLYVAQSSIFKKKFSLELLKISYSHDVKELGLHTIEKYKRFIVIFTKLVKKLLNFKPDLIYFQISPLGAAFLRDLVFVTMIKLFRIKILFHLHGKGIEDKSQNVIWRCLYKFTFNNEYIICSSNLVSGDVKNVFRGKPFIVNNGIESVVEIPRIHKNKLKPVILFLSNLFTTKGIYYFLQSLAELNKKGIDFEGWIIGAEGDVKEQELINYMRENNITNKVKFFGPLYDKEKYNKLLEADIFVFPTLNDIWGLVLLEAMQCGLPTIASREGAIPEIIEDGITGYIVDKASVDQITDRITMLINDPALRRKIGENGRKKFLNNYTIDKFENKLSNIFETVLEDN